MLTQIWLVVDLPGPTPLKKNGVSWLFLEKIEKKTMVPVTTKQRKMIILLHFLSGQFPPPHADFCPIKTLKRHRQFPKKVPSLSPHPQKIANFRVHKISHSKSCPKTLLILSFIFPPFFLGFPIIFPRFS